MASWAAGAGPGPEGEAGEAAETLAEEENGEHDTEQHVRAAEVRETAVPGAGGGAERPVPWWEDSPTAPVQVNLNFAEDPALRS